MSPERIARARRAIDNHYRGIKRDYALAWLSAVLGNGTAGSHPAGITINDAQAIRLRIGFILSGDL